MKQLLLLFLLLVSPNIRVATEDNDGTDKSSYTYNDQLLNLLKAAENGSLSIIKEVLRVVPHKQLTEPATWQYLDGNANEDTPLHKAASRDQIGALKLLLPVLRNSLLLEPNGDQLMPFHVAVINNSVQVIEYLLNLDKPTLLQLSEARYSRTPAYLAAEYGHLNLLKLLASHGASLQVESSLEYGAAYPIHEAAHYGFVDIVKFLHSKGSSVSRREGWYKRTVLHEAAISGSLELVKFAVEHGADLYSRSHISRDHYSQPIHWAAAMGHLDIVEFMLTQEPYLIDEGDRDGDRPFHVAALNNRTDIVEYFVLQLGIDIATTQLCFERTMLHQAASKGHLGLVKKLIDLGADPWKRSNSFDCGKMPVHLAAAQCRIATLGYLLSRWPNMLITFDGCGRSLEELTKECIRFEDTALVSAWLKYRRQEAIPRRRAADEL